jgi:hypothetical protein
MDSLASKKLLIAAGQAASSIGELPFGVRTLIDEASEILVIAPTLPSRLDWLTSATDRSRERADERLEAVLGQLEGLDPQAEGAVGADDPLTAFDDAVAEFSPDHIVIGLREADRAGWQERGLLDEVLARFAVPVTVFQIT